MYSDDFSEGNINFKKIFIYILLSSVILIVILSFAFNKSSYSKISNIYIYGNEITGRELIGQVVALNVGDKIYKIRGNKIENNLKLINTVKDAKVHYKFPNFLTIDIIDKKIAYYIYKDSQLEAVLEDGFQLKNSDKFFQYISRPIITGSVIDNEKYYLAQGLINLPEATLSNLSEIIILENGELTAYTNDGYELRMFYNEFYDKMLIYSNINDIIDINNTSKGIINMYDAIWFIPYNNIEGEKS